MFRLSYLLVIGITVNLVVFNACADRERKNPIDPRNPVTQGKPTDVNVYSIEDTVFLTWDLINLEDLSGYRIYRRTNAGDSELLASVGPDVNMFVDAPVTFGTPYSYQVSAFGPTYESIRSETMSVTPGPTVTWVGDEFGRQIIKLTHDAGHAILRVSGFFTTVDIEPDPKTGIVWVIDEFGGQLLRVPENDSRGELAIQFSRPIDAALDVSRAKIWVADIQNDTVTKLEPSGKIAFVLNRDPASGFEFQNPSSVSVDQNTGDCWVADDKLDEVVKIKSDGSKISPFPVRFNGLQSLSTDSKRRFVWVADSSQVVRLGMEGNSALLLNESFDYAYKIAVDDSTGDIWILNLIFDLNRSTVKKFSSDGQKQFERDGFTIPEDLSVNLYDHSCVIADTQNDRVVHLSSNGDIINTFNKLGNPQAIGVRNKP